MLGDLNRKQPFNRSSQRLYDHVGVHAGQGLIRSQVKTQCGNGWDSIPNLGQSGPEVE